MDKWDGRRSILFWGLLRAEVISRSSLRRKNSSSVYLQESSLEESEVERQKKSLLKHSKNKRFAFPTRAKGVWRKVSEAEINVFR